ncbi:MAG: hypothetical protein K0B16_09590 [Burkholderiaceae bacterium]|nr:hypothetical protein [Burkholderiaceae bacterium]
MNPSHSATPSPTLVRALRHILRPLVRLMLASGVTFPIVSELLKGVFVEVAERDFRLHGRAMTDSRINLISGVHRKDIRRLRESDLSVAEVVPETVSFGGRLVATWLTDGRFLDETGSARPLPKIRAADGGVCFADLVASRTTDIRQRVVLDEWLRLGIVSIDDQDRVVLNTAAFVPQPGLDEKFFFFAHNLHEHAAAATNNLLGARAPQLERSLIYEGLTPASVEHLDKRARQLGTRMLKELNRLASEREASEAGNPEARGRFTCGVYFHSAPVDIAGGEKAES